MNDVKMGLTPLEARQEETAAGAVVPEAGAVGFDPSLVDEIAEYLCDSYQQGLSSDRKWFSERDHKGKRLWRGDAVLLLRMIAEHPQVLARAFAYGVQNYNWTDHPKIKEQLRKVLIFSMTPTPPLQEPSTLPVTHK